MAAALRTRQLGSDAQSVTQLGLAGPELSERLRDRHALDAALKQSVESGGTSRDALNVLASLENRHTRLEALALDLLRYLVALIRTSIVL